MNALALQKCLNHPAREAVARCPSCTQPYCRECVVDHDGRALCAACVRKLVAEAAPRPRWGRRALAGFQVFIGILFLWLLFFGVGRVLLAIPASFHEGDLWKKEASQ